MQSDKEFVLDAMQRIGKTIAQNIQSRAAEMTGTELYAEEDYIPDFAAACDLKNMLERTAGFVCRSSAGRACVPLEHRQQRMGAQRLPAGLDAAGACGRTV